MPRLPEGSATNGQRILGSLRKQAEQAQGSKPVSSTPPQPLLQFLPPGPALTSLTDGPSTVNETDLSPQFGLDLPNRNQTGAQCKQAFVQQQKHWQFL